jgi:protein-S-isoprenylcysteine O-methyltransferase Ste14
MNDERASNSGNPLRLLMRVPVPWVFVLTYLFGVCLEYAFPLRETIGPRLAFGIVGGALLAMGTVVAAWSLFIFRKARTTTIPGRKSAKLVTWGPYRFSRNPMYISLTAAYLGEAGILKQIWPVLLLPLTIAYIHWIVIPVEEARLTEAFEGDYRQYREKVRRWI